MTPDPGSRGRIDSTDLVISIDAMSGDRGPAVVVAGMADCARDAPDVNFILHGDEPELAALLARSAALTGRVEIRHAPGKVSMDEKPSRVMRSARDTSMLSAIDAVAGGEAGAIVSCGNTGALMALSVLRLRRAPGVDRPAIAVLWPSDNPAGRNIVLDVGADIRADPGNLLQFAVMGAEYARIGLNLGRPRVGLLNVGSEAHKGTADLRRAAEMIDAEAARPGAGMTYAGFVEGGDILSSRVDVIVTDGFTGNTALKTAEGTARLILEQLRLAFDHSLLSRLGALAAKSSLRRLQARIDPRRANGGVFLGLNGAVVKSHGDADATGVGAAIRLAATMARNAFTDQVAEHVANALLGRETAVNESSAAEKSAK